MNIPKNIIEYDKLKKLIEEQKKFCNRMLFESSNKDKDYWHGFRSGYLDAIADVIKELE